MNHGLMLVSLWIVWPCTDRCNSNRRDGAWTWKCVCTLAWK